jgi:hypothetical protein
MDVGKRVVLFFAFQRAKQPERIKEVLEMVYSSNDTIDQDLVDSIVVPASDPKAAEVCHHHHCIVRGFSRILMHIAVVLSS